MDIAQGITLYLILVGSISVHEWAHAYSADRLGDDLPASQGRVTLNPIAHIDPIGTVVLPLFMIFAPMGGLAIFGWGKPVQINPRSHKNPVRDDLIITSAGPLSNLVIALGAAIIGSMAGLVNQETLGLFGMIIMLNVVLFVFNLIPIPPLDGSHFLKHAIGMTEEAFFKLSMYGFIIILVLINIPGFRLLMSTAIHAVMAPFVWLLLLTQ